jgi:large subunit ribosomal protein L1
MATLSKRQKAFKGKIDPPTSLSRCEALKLSKEFAAAKFDESIDVAVCLGVDPRKSDQIVRGSVVLPAGTGKTIRVAVFAQGEKAAAAKAAGADIVGFEDLAAEIKAGVINFDRVIATPDAMRVVGQLGQILGPRGLMPNPKVGTVTMDVVTAVQNAKAGQVQYRTDKGGIIHSTIGRASFEADRLALNLKALLDALIKAKPATSKGSMSGGSRCRARWGRVSAWMRLRCRNSADYLAWSAQRTLLGDRRCITQCRWIVKDRRCWRRLPRLKCASGLRRRCAPKRIAQR